MPLDCVVVEEDKNGDVAGLFPGQAQPLDVERLWLMGAPVVADGEGEVLEHSADIELESVRPLLLPALASLDNLSVDQEPLGVITCLRFKGYDTLPLQNGSFKQFEDLGGALDDQLVGWRSIYSLQSLSPRSLVTPQLLFLLLILSRRETLGHLLNLGFIERYEVGEGEKDLIMQSFVGLDCRFMGVDGEVGVPGLVADPDFEVDEFVGPGLLVDGNGVDLRVLSLEVALELDDLGLVASPEVEHYGSGLRLGLLHQVELELLDLPYAGEVRTPLLLRHPLEDGGLYLDQPDY
mmetsp:Transcript_18005/g.30655  ORF Transcript_18005/g.30655 Transcript_18005/m.30655 type:complete len:293 (+) Transcript_18005:422-1300(+)